VAAVYGIDDARLITAAPDLLAACKVVVEQLTSGSAPVGIMPDVLPYSIRLCQEAFAKAKGQI
jgi:hypothetical protein